MNNSTPRASVSDAIASGACNHPSMIETASGATVRVVCPICKPKPYNNRLSDYQTERVLYERSGT